jgi:hypothetical protein
VVTAGVSTVLPGFWIVFYNKEAPRIYAGPKFLHEIFTPGILPGYRIVVVNVPGAQRLREITKRQGFNVTIFSGILAGSMRKKYDCCVKFFVIFVLKHGGNAFLCFLLMAPELSGAFFIVF